MLTVSLVFHPAYAATRTWDGGGTDGTCGGGAGDGNKWSCAANWSADTVPVSGDAVVFDATSTKDSTIDTSFAGTITSLNINAGYTGTVTMARSLTVSGAYTQAAGTFAQGTQTLTVGANFSHTAGTFTANTGTVVLSGSAAVLSGATTFYKLQVLPTADANATVTFPAGTTTTIANDADFSAGNPTLRTLTVKSSSGGSAAQIDFQGSVSMYRSSVQDIENVNATEVHCYVFCTDGGGNTNIRFGEPGFVITPMSADVFENGTTATFTVALRGKPKNSVSIPLSSADTGEVTVSPSSLTFTTGNYATPQTVTMTGVADSTNDGAVDVAIVLGAATSSDTLYSGRDPRDRSVRVRDVDTAADAILFVDPAKVSVQDDKGTITWFERFSEGRGNLKTTNGGANVNISSTRIEAGCSVTVAGTAYLITHVVNAATGDVILTDEKTPPETMSTNLASGTVSAISCLHLRGNGAQLGGASILLPDTKDDLAADDINFGFLEMDETNGKVWATDYEHNEVIGISLSTGQETNRLAVTNAYDTALDTTRNRLWVSNFDPGNLTVINTATGAYAFGTQGASTFSTGGITAADIMYNPELDEIWVPDVDSFKFVRVNASNGSVVSTTTFVHKPMSFGYDPTRHVVWISTEGDVNNYLVKMNAATGAFANGTELASTQIVYGREGYDAGTIGRLTYDETRDVFWGLTQFDLDETDTLVKIDAATGKTLSAYDVGGNVQDYFVDEDHDKIYVAFFAKSYTTYDDETSGIDVFDADTGEMLSTHATHGYINSISGEDDGTVWFFDNHTMEIDRMATGVAPENIYVTAASNASGNLDFTRPRTLERASVDEALNGGQAYYSVSFDGRQSYKVHGSWRTIASSLAADHGGVNGNWYYRDNANVWTAAPSNTAPDAISLAVQSGANNRMTGSAVNAITSAGWTEAGGFSASTASIDMAVTLRTTDGTMAPVVNRVHFSFAQGTSSPEGTTDTGVRIMNDLACVRDPQVTLSLFGASVSAVRVSDVPFSETESAEWIPFVADESIPPTTSASGAFIRTMTLPWTIPEGDGVKTVYAQFRSPSGQTSAVAEDAITLSAACGAPVPPPVVPPEPVIPGKLTYVRTAGASTVYYLTDTQTRRAFMSATEYFTYEKDFSPVQVVDESIIAAYDVGKPMPPKPGSVLIKTPSSPRVYAFDPTATIDRPLIRWIPSETLARAFVGVDWAAYVIDVDPTSLVRLEIGQPFAEQDQIDRSLLLPRSTLIGRIERFLQYAAHHAKELLRWARSTSHVPAQSISGLRGKYPGKP
jgi:hypothetical protein